jgi:hypothetical protein
LVLARQFAAATGAVFVHPFDDRQIIIGQGTVALEIFEQCPDVATVVVCTGGGGMLAGVAMAIKQLNVSAGLRFSSMFLSVTPPAAQSSSHRRASRACCCLPTVSCSRQAHAAEGNELHRRRRQRRHSRKSHIWCGQVRVRVRARVYVCFSCVFAS